MKTASRTLVKSPPELWEMIDQAERMEGMMSGLLGRAADVSVSEREPESLLCWEATGVDEYAWIKVKLAEKGWGTHVEVSAESKTEPVKLAGWLDAVLEELATPQKRPFRGMTETPADTVAEAVANPEPVAETTPDEPEAAEEPAEPEPVAEAPESEPAEPKPAPAPRKKKRFFGLF
jgi:hypothetical protein